MMVFFNDPVEVADPAERAVRMSIAIRDRIQGMVVQWKKRGLDLSLGIGIAQGFATIGAIGFEGRSDYAAIGTVTNLAARLCGEAKGGQILTNRKTLSEIEHVVEADPVGALSLKGLPVRRRLSSLRGSKPAPGYIRNNTRIDALQILSGFLRFLNEFFCGSGYCHSARGRIAA